MTLTSQLLNLMNKGSLPFISLIDLDWAFLVLFTTLQLNVAVNAAVQPMTLDI